MSTIAERIAALPRDSILCDTCAKPNAQRRCSRCHLVFYCDEACQKNAWKQHKLDCRSVTFMRANLLGFNEEEIHMQGINTECSICLSDTIDQPVILKACQHAFCLKCLQDWQRFKPMNVVSKKCPLCREVLKETNAAESLLERARLLAGKAIRSSSSEEDKERYKDETLDILDGVITAGGDLPHIQAFVTKAEVLKLTGEYEKALAVVDEIIRLNDERTDRQEELEYLLRMGEAANLREDFVEEERLFDEAAAQVTNLGTRMAGNNTTKYFDTYLLQAECYQGLKEWRKAIDLYKSILAMLDNPEDATPQQTRQIFIGLARCSYELGAYDRCIDGSDAAISMNRHFPGCHKYKALSEKALGKLDKSIATMIEACLYETPWDDKNKKEQLDLYDELVAEVPPHESKK
jgi:tetratricopeptide (TPR) repeat protein